MDNARQELAKMGIAEAYETILQQRDLLAKALRNAMAYMEADSDDVDERVDFAAAREALDFAGKWVV